MPPAHDKPPAKFILKEYRSWVGDPAGYEARILVSLSDYQGMLDRDGAASSAVIRADVKLFEELLALVQEWKAGKRQG